MSILLTCQVAIVGLMQLSGSEPIATNVRNLGYADWARIAVGIFQLGAVILLWVPRYRFTSSLLLAFVLLVAVASHLRVHDTAKQTLPAGVTFALLMTLAFLNSKRLLTTERTNAGRTVTAD